MGMKHFPPSRSDGGENECTRGGGEADCSTAVRVASDEQSEREIADVVQPSQYAQSVLLPGRTHTSEASNSRRPREPRSASHARSVCYRAVSFRVVAGRTGGRSEGAASESRAFREWRHTVGENDPLGTVGFGRPSVAR